MEAIEVAATLDAFEHPLPTTFAYSPAGSTFFTTAVDGLIKLWDSDTGELLATSRAYTQMDSISLNPNGEFYAVPYWDRVEVIETETQALVQTFELPVSRLSWGAVDSRVNESQVKYIASETIGLMVRYGSVFHTFTYDAGSNQILQEFQGPDGKQYYQCKYNSDRNRQVCQVSNWQSSTLHIADPMTSELFMSVQAETAYFNAISNAGHLFVSCREEAALFSITPLDGGVARPYQFPCQDMVFLPGDIQLLLADGTVVEVESREVVSTFAFPSPYVEFGDVFFSPNDDFMLIGTDIYDLSTGDFLGQLDIDGKIHGITLSADGLSLIILTEFGLEYWQVLE